MTYYVHASDGNKYGPAEIADLQGWVTDGRIGPDTLLERESDGVKGAARFIPGLTFASAVPAPAVVSAAPPVAAASPYPREWNQAPTGPLVDPDARSTAIKAIAWGVGAIALGFFIAFGAFFCGITAIQQGASANSRGEKLGWVGIALGVVAIAGRLAMIVFGGQPLFGRG